jgi:hypothetical protein
MFLFPLVKLACGQTTSDNLTYLIVGPTTCKHKNQTYDFLFEWNVKHHVKNAVGYFNNYSNLCSCLAPSQSCAFTICKSDPSICRIRLDFNVRFFEPFADFRSPTVIDNYSF